MVVHGTKSIQGSCFCSLFPAFSSTLLRDGLLFQDLDIVVRQLLAKAGESNNFIRDDVERALAGMVEGVTSQRALLALINGGTT